MGITGYTSLRFIHNNMMKGIFTYQPETDIFKCTEGNTLSFSKLIYKKGTGYYRLYRIEPGSCGNCEKRVKCEATNRNIRVNASPYYPSYYANRLRHDTTTYTLTKKLRGIWAEGTFAALKNFHNL